jgi:hypothetical protein
MAESIQKVGFMVVLIMLPDCWKMPNKAKDGGNAVLGWAGRGADTQENYVQSQFGAVVRAPSWQSKANYD